MERKWLEKFYTECGREVSLAYNVVNHSNNWGVTLATAVLAATFLGAVRVENGKVSILYPTIIHWFYIIVAWVIMLRFFVRSALGLANMYRWNTLIFSSAKVLSLAENSPALPVYARNCAKKIDAYYFRWKSPISKRALIWRNMKLMYLWFFLIVLGLFCWGLVELEKNVFYFIGIGAFCLSTLVESIFFSTWYGLKYEKLDLEEEPQISGVWQQKENTIVGDKSKLLVLGFCTDGPYKHAIDLLNNHDTKWLPWSYHVASIDPPVVSDLSKGYSLKDKRIAFACWPKNFKGNAPILRFGKIDYYLCVGGMLRLTVFLENYDESIKDSTVPVNYYNCLCFYL